MTLLLCLLVWLGKYNLGATPYDTIIALVLIDLDLIALSALYIGWQIKGWRADWELERDIEASKIAKMVK